MGDAARTRVTVDHPVIVVVQMTTGPAMPGLSSRIMR
jgi:hypothetical protein